MRSVTETAPECSTADVAFPPALGSEASLWNEKLRLMRQLHTGWNGYDAEPPSELALANAEQLLEAMEREQFPPTRVAPSVVGGVGITRRNGEKRVYVEFYNDGRVHSLLAEKEEAATAAIEVSTRGFTDFIHRARGYLNA